MTKRYSYRDGYTSFAFAVEFFIAVQLIFSFVIAQTETGSVWYWLVLAVCNASLLAAAFAYAKVRKADFLSATTLNVKPKVAHLLWGFLVVLGLIHFMVPVNGWIGDLFVKIGLKRPQVDLPMQLAPLLIVASVIPAVCEEVMFRGTIGNAFTCGDKPVWKGILLSGALFSVFHMNPAQTLHQFVLGCFLTVLTYRSGSVWTAIAVHLFNNVVAVLLSYFVEGTGFYQKYAVWVCLAGAVVTALAVWGYFATTKVAAKSNVETDGEVVDTGVETEKSAQNGRKFDSNALIMFFVALAVCVALWVANLF